jgi:endonuclease G
MFRRLLKKTASSLALAFLLAAVTADWFVHQPRHWQQAQTARLPAALASRLLQFGNASADFTDALGLTGRDAAASLTAPLATNRLACAGLPVRTGDGAPRDIVVLERKGFTVGYSPSLRHPVWVAYKTHPVHAPELPPRPSGFKPDPEAKNSPQHKEYAKSGYDRGHMAPNLAIASRHGKDAQLQTFLTSNVCPQRPGLNQGPWRDLEFRISELWPDRYGEVWVIVGAVSPPGGKRLPSGIGVPTAFYQIAVAQEAGRVRAFAVYMPQTIPRRAYARSTLVSIDEIERVTGLDFLAGLPDDTEAALEAAVPTRLWPTGFPGLFKLLRERFRDYDGRGSPHKPAVKPQNTQNTRN